MGAFLAGLAVGVPQEAMPQESIPIVWRGTLSRQPAANEELVITTPAGGNRRLMIKRRDAAAPSLPSLPLATDLLPLGPAASFGADARCSIAAEGQAFRVRCRPGSSISGAVFSFPEHRLPRHASFRLELTSQGSSGFTAEVTALRGDARAPMPVGSGRSMLPLPTAEIQPQLVVLAPAGGGELVLRSARLLPSTGAAAAKESSAWIWSPQKWRAAPAQVIEAAKARKLERLFVSLEILEGNLLHGRELRRFVGMATAAGIKVEAVEGDPQMVLAEGLQAAAARARAFAAYQRSAPDAERLAGIQYDIEPYILEGWGDDPISYPGWAQAVLTLSQAAGEKVDLVVPFWIHDAAGGRQFLPAVKPAIRSLTVMSYRTQTAELTQIAEPLLAWGAAEGVKVRLALEAGPLPDETEEVFRPAASGTLAVMPGARPRAYLLQRSGVMNGAVMFERRNSFTIEARRLSFLGREKAMRDLADAMAPIFSAWPSFGGFALHGLDWDGPARR